MASSYCYAVFRCITLLGNRRRRSVGTSSTTSSDEIKAVNATASRHNNLLLVIVDSEDIDSLGKILLLSLTADEISDECKRRTDYGKGPNR